MPTKNVVITPQQEKMIDRMVSSGKYQNASEIMRLGLRLVHEREEEEKAKLKALREAAHAGIADIEAGRYRAFSSFDEMDRYLKRRTDKTIARLRGG